VAFRNLYGFLSQVIPYQDSDLERLYVFLRHLGAKLPRRKGGAPYHFDEEVRLEYYRLQKISEGSISLQEGKARAVDGPAEVGTGIAREGSNLVGLPFSVCKTNEEESCAMATKS
jgi:type I restriction enzyme R subunit